MYCNSLSGKTQPPLTALFSLVFIFDLSRVSIESTTQVEVPVTGRLTINKIHSVTLENDKYLSKCQKSFLRPSRDVWYMVDKQQQLVVEFHMEDVAVLFKNNPILLHVYTG